MRGVFIGKKAMTPDELLQLGGGAMPAEELLGLRAFVESPCMVIEGAVVIRRVLIKYVSNKLGGAHFDRTRGFSQEEIAFRRLDSVGSTLRLADKNAIYFELLSIGQALARERMTSVCFATKSRPIRAEVLVNARWVPRAFRKAVALQAEIRRPGGLTKTVFPSSANVDGIGGSHHCPARCRAE